MRPQNSRITKNIFNLSGESEATFVDNDFYFGKFGKVRLSHPMNEG